MKVSDEMMQRSQRAISTLARLTRFTCSKSEFPATLQCSQASFLTCAHCTRTVPSQACFQRAQYAACVLRTVLAIRIWSAVMLLLRNCLLLCMVSITRKAHAIGNKKQQNKHITSHHHHGLTTATIDIIATTSRRLLLW